MPDPQITVVPAAHAQAMIDELQEQRNLMASRAAGLAAEKRALNDELAEVTRQRDEALARLSAIKAEPAVEAEVIPASEAREPGRGKRAPH